MNCPKCGAAVQPYDRFCIRCGHDMQPSGAASRDGDGATTSYNAGPGVGMGAFGAPAAPASPWQAPPSATIPGQGQPSGGPSQGGPSYGGAAQQGPFGNWAPGRPGQPGQGAPGAPGGTNWASGSSTPGPNPYAGAPSTVSSGTMLNGRPANAGGRGLLQGLGAAVVALFVLLGKFGGAIASIGFFKLWFFAWIFHGLFGMSFGTIFLVLLVVAILAGFARSRGLV